MGSGELGAALGSAADESAESGRELARVGADIDAAGLRLPEVWRGLAAEASGDDLAVLAEQAHELASRARHLEQMIRVEGAAFAAAAREQAELDADLSEADLAGRSLAPLGPTNTELKLAASARTRQLDAAFAARLRSLVGPAGATPTTTDAVAAFLEAVRTGAPPDAISELWHQLSPGERAAVEREPGLESVDGLPAADRNRLGRRSLAAFLDAADDPDDPALAGLRALREELERDPDLHLLGWDPGGQATLAQGDPDSADFLHVHVGGTGSSLESIDRELERARGVCDETSDRLSTADSTDAEAPCAAVVFQDYDAPSTLLDAALAPAQALTGQSDRIGTAAGSLRGLLDGLEASGRQYGDGERRSLVSGYSFGAMPVVAAAAAPGGLHADALATVGAPAVGYHRVPDLTISREGKPASATAEDVVAIHAPTDPIPLAGLVPGFGVPSWSNYFGATQAFVTDTMRWPWDPGHAHSALLDPGSSANRILADVLVGDR